MEGEICWPLRLQETDGQTCRSQRIILAEQVHQKQEAFTTDSPPPAQWN
ncbi:hypothetical protein ACN4EG_10175 [Alkalinema pantanalense CENA528]